MNRPRWPEAWCPRLMHQDTSLPKSRAALEIRMKPA